MEKLVKITIKKGFLHLHPPVLRLRWMKVEREIRNIINSLYPTTLSLTIGDLGYQKSLFEGDLILFRI